MNKAYGTNPILSSHSDGTFMKNKVENDIGGEREQLVRDQDQKEKEFEWLKFLNRPKHIYEEDPLNLKIDQIAGLASNTKVFKHDNTDKSFRGSDA